MSQEKTFPIKLEPCVKCKKKNRLVNAKVGQAFCNICLGLRLDIGTRALQTLSQLTEEEIRTMSAEEIQIYEHRVKGNYMDNLMYGK